MAEATLPLAVPTDALSTTPLAEALLPHLSVGALLGFATGLALKRLGRLVLLALQLLAYFDLVTVHWPRVQALAEPWLRQGGEAGVEWLGRVLTARLPFAGAFTVGLLVGLRARG